MEDQVQALLRGQLAEVILGSIFLFMGLAACSIAAVRRRSGLRLVIWLGIVAHFAGKRHTSSDMQYDALAIGAVA